MSDILEFGRSVLRQEAEGLDALVPMLDESFVAAVEAIRDCRGHVVLTGVGKPWLIGQKISATLASTGTPSFSLHASEAAHGDLGRLRDKDVVIAISNSGESEELVRLLPIVKGIGCRLIGMTSAPGSALGKHSDILLSIAAVGEACPIGMAPSVSTTMMLALGDALALAVMKANEFAREDYARYHPGGALGRSLMKVDEIMRPLDETATVGVTGTVRKALESITSHKSGAVFIVDGEVLKGVFTDGDLRRHIEADNLLDLPVADVMTSPCKSIDSGKLAPEAVAIMRPGRIGELPVVDESGRLVGHVALKDLSAMNFL